MKNSIVTLIFILLCIIVKPQNPHTTFGMQYKPIIPVKYFNSSYVIKESTNYNFNLKPKYSNSFGMIIRHEINKTFSIESGINYIQRNYQLISTQNLFSDFTNFSVRSYEIPIQLLTYVRASEFWYLNVAFGISHNILASDVFSSGEQNKNYYQNSYRQNGGYSALLANLGMEYRTKTKGHYYIGASLHRTWYPIVKIYPQIEENGIKQIDNDFSLDIIGNFITIDFRYFFPE